MARLLPWSESYYSPDPKDGACNIWFVYAATLGRIEDYMLSCTAAGAPRNENCTVSLGCISCT